MVRDAVPNQVFEVLLVEDNPSEARLAREVLKEGRVTHQVHLVTNGDDALDFLRRQGNFPQAPTPDLVLLDLNLPRRSGHEVLREIKQDDGLRHIPVVVLTTSTNEDDVRLAYSNNANCYITKPMDLDHFVKSVQMLSEFWFNVVNLPPRPNDSGLGASPVSTSRS